MSSVPEAPASPDTTASPGSPGSPDSPADELLALHRGGRLAAEFPRLKALLARLPEADSARAAQLLSRVDPADVLREHPALPS